jgi:hypothetical protein
MWNTHVIILGGMFKGKQDKSLGVLSEGGGL